MSEIQDGSKVAGVDVGELEAEIRAFLMDVRALVADHWSGCVPERQVAIASAPYVDAQVFTEDLHPPHPPLGPRDPDWLRPLLSLYSATAALPPPNPRPSDPPLHT